jgi:dolichol-phosphate mannosyltransferase
MGPAVTIVVPTYDEADTLPLLVDALAAEVRREWELLVVDDGSPDGTAQVAERLGEEHPVRVLRRTERGLATAVLDGIGGARHGLVVVMDADLSFPASTVERLLAALSPSTRLAVASRYVEGGRVEGWGPWRWLNSRVATALARPLTAVRDPMSGCFALRRADLPEGLQPLGYKVLLELLVRTGWSAVEVPVTFVDRQVGRSKLSVGERVAYLRHLQRLYRHRWPVAVELASFLAVGATGLVVDLVTLALCVELAGLPFAVARVAGFGAAVAWQFGLHDRITFAGGGARVHGVAARFALYLGAASIGLVVNWVVSMAAYSWVPLLQQAYPVAAALGVVAGTAFNFVGARQVAFRRAT